MIKFKKALYEKALFSLIAKTDKCAKIYL